MMSILLDHLWQSSAVLGGIGLLTLLFRNNGAHVRHALWMAASLKFLVPFALLNGLGIWFARLVGVDSPSLAVVETLFAVGQPFSDGPIFRAMPMPSLSLWFVILGAWAAGSCGLLLFWGSRWRQLSGIVKGARDLAVAAPMPVKISPLQIEPGLVGFSVPYCSCRKVSAKNFIRTNFRRLSRMKLAICAGATISWRRCTCWCRHYSGSGRRSGGWGCA